MLTNIRHFCCSEDYYLPTCVAILRHVSGGCKNVHYSNANRASPDIRDTRDKQLLMLNVPTGLSLCPKAEPVVLK